MDGISKSPLLQISKEEIMKIKALVNLGNEDTINEDIDKVLEWFDKQQHLPRIKLERCLVERILINRKGSVEQTKQKIDMMFTIRTLIPDLAAPRDILHPDLQRQFKGMVYATMPKLNHDLTRINVIHITKELESLEMADAPKYVFSTIEYRLRYDYCAGDRYVFDYQHATLGYLAKLSPILVKHCEIYLKHMALESLVFIAIGKAALSAKLASRMQVHSTYEDLHKHVSKRSLPSDYGGDELSLEMYAERWRQELSKEENRKFLKEQETLRSDEALRIGARKTDEMLGIPGSFKKINID